jgi:hypothetical protein
MGTRVPDPPVSNEDAFSALARDLGTARSPEEILEHLSALYGALCDPATGADRANRFLLADGLPAVIRHLMGAATSEGKIKPEDLSSAIPDAAAGALTELFRHMDAPMVGRITTAADILALIDALRSAPTLISRSAATDALLKLAEAQPTHHKLMADAGVFDLVSALYDIIGAQPRMNWEDPLIRDTLDVGAALVRVLVRSKTAAVAQLRRSISASKADVVFNALVILQVSLLLFTPCCLLAKMKPCSSCPGSPR